jgi:hypothetical protein
MDLVEYVGTPSSGLMMLMFWMPFLIPMVVAIVGIVMLQRILAGQRAIRARLEAIEQRLSQSSGS